MQAFLLDARRVLAQSVKEEVAAAQSAAERWVMASCLTPTINALQHQREIRAQALSISPLHCLLCSCCRLESIKAQHELHNELKVMRCEKYVNEAMHEAILEAEQQVSIIATWRTYRYGCLGRACTGFVPMFCDKPISGP